MNRKGIVREMKWLFTGFDGFFGFVAGVIHIVSDGRTNEIFPKRKLRIILNNNLAATRETGGFRLFE